MKLKSKFIYIILFVSSFFLCSGVIKSDTIDNKETSINIIFTKKITNNQLPSNSVKKQNNQEIKDNALLCQEKENLPMTNEFQKSYLFIGLTLISLCVFIYDGRRRGDN